MPAEKNASGGGAVSSPTGGCSSQYSFTGLLKSDFFGRAVNLTARLQALADPGDVVLSSAVFEAPGVGEFLHEDHLAT